MRRSKAGRGNVEGAAVDVQKQGMVGGRSDGSMPISQRGRVSCVLVSDGSGKGHSAQSGEAAAGTETDLFPLGDGGQRLRSPQKDQRRPPFQ